MLSLVYETSSVPPFTACPNPNSGRAATAHPWEPRAPRITSATPIFFPDMTHLAICRTDTAGTVPQRLRVATPRTSAASAETGACLQRLGGKSYTLTCSSFRVETDHVKEEGFLAMNTFRAPARTTGG